MGIEEEGGDEEEDRAVGEEEEIILRMMAERIDKVEVGGGEDAVVGLLLR
jgi:hypothetical protein